MAAHGTPEGFDEWLAARGYVLPLGAPSAAILRQRATDYIDGLYGPRLIGDPTVVPLLTALANATYAAALYEAQNPGGLSVAASQSGAIKREKVDVLEVEYVAGSGDAVADATVRLSAVEGYLAPYLRLEGVAGLGLWAVG
ncbi:MULTISPECIES: DnaT-like ssDNA-binding protein [unclassified Brevundimonas]|uniref:DnaT-like ssDNA-binding protein n=1 Tax=unclassified Brevundimonas TaxID=2622653 RepID=UPI0025C6DF33|nr:MULTISPECIES: DnaT-like ssDNA-binding protein [unclassified Brevundimonas]